MLSHVHVGISDLPHAFALYAAMMEELGLVLRFHEPDQGWAGWMQDGAEQPLFLIGRPYDGAAAEPGNGNMIALLAPDRACVDRCHALALSTGGRDEGVPGLRPWYHPNYYGA